MTQWDFVRTVGERSWRRLKGSAGSPLDNTVYLASCFSHWDTIGWFKFNAEKPVASSPDKGCGLIQTLALPPTSIPGLLAPLSLTCDAVGELLR